MRKIFLFVVLIIILALPCLAAEPEMRGTWVSTVYNLDYPSSSGLSQTQLKAEIDKIIDSTAEMGLNTIFLQVRPTCDAIYPSGIFPWSKYISGQQGVAPDGEFDTLDYFINAAHSQGIELHAWINPYRVTVSAFESLEEGMASLSDNNPAKNNPQWVLYGNDKKLYLDPALPEVQQLILDGIDEIAQNYAVDGIHLDDYFYPDGGFDDSKSFEVYGGIFENIDDFRRDNVNRIVKKIHSLCKEHELTFGISPFGIWANYIYNELGSLTAGNQSYYTHYADTRLWVKEGWLDYIAPQLYWAIGASEGEFEQLLIWWRDTVSGTGVDLYIGLAAYRLTDATQGSEWYNGDEIIRQLKMMDMYGQTDGVIFFRHQSLTQCDNLSDYLDRNYTYPLPKIDDPIFIQNSRTIEVHSPQHSSRKISGVSFNVSCSAPNGSVVHAVTDDRHSQLIRKGSDYYGELQSDSRGGILFICDRNGFLSIKAVGTSLLSSKKENSLVNIDWQTIDGFTMLTFYTKYPAAANCHIDNGYVNLEIAPARVGLVFECDNISTMICEKLSGYVKYVFDMYTPPSECYVKEYDDRIEVYIK